MKAEESFISISHHPSSINRMLRIFVSVMFGFIFGVLLTFLGMPLLDSVFGHVAWLKVGAGVGILGGLGVGMGLARLEELTFGTILGTMGYVILGMVGYALLFGLIGLLFWGGLGFQVGAAIGAVVGTAVGLYARLIKYRYRHF